MKVIILAAGQGTRMRPLTAEMPAGMVKINGKSIMEHQLETLHKCGISEKDITVVTGYCGHVLREQFCDTGICFVENEKFDKTNMVWSMMCAKEVLKTAEDVIVSYGNIIYSPDVLERLIASDDMISAVVDDAWQEYWSARYENPLEHAVTMCCDDEDYIVEIGQKPERVEQVQAQFAGLVRFKEDGVQSLLDITKVAKRRSEQGKALWRTMRSFAKMYMTDLFQGFVDENYDVHAVHIRRGWYEISEMQDVALVEREWK